MIEIIAEIGVNHQGKLDTALLLVDEAKSAGANVVKFQMFSAEKLGRPELKDLELSKTELRTLMDYCDSIGIEFLCTPFDVEAVRFLDELGVKRIKISSGCLRRKDILEAVRKTGKPVILSTGMSSLEEIGKAMDVLYLNPLTLMHCCSAYPAPLEDMNLRAMLKMPFSLMPYGLSDHTKGITAAIAAAAFGATIIEKHLTLDCRAPGPDHAASIEPDEFRAMVKAIREVELMLGDGVKRIMPSEEKTRALWA